MNERGAFEETFQMASLTPAIYVVFIKCTNFGLLKVSYMQTDFLVWLNMFISLNSDCNCKYYFPLCLL